MGFPSIGYSADNGEEFANDKMDRLVSKFGLNIQFGPAYSSWSNGINERNYASADTSIKSLLNDKKVKLTKCW